jgi:DNA polymerase V
MSIVGLRLKHELEGKSRLTLENSRVKKSIATTRTFERPYTKIDDIRESITTFSVRCAEKLRKQKSCCNVIMVFVHTNRFRKDLPQYSKSIIISLPYPTNSSIELTKFAYKAAKSIFKPGFEYKKAGVIAMDIVPENQQQVSLFENSDPRHKKLMKIIDQLNDDIGQQKVRLGSQGTGRTWKMRQERLSPKYTTKLSDIISVNV